MKKLITYTILAALFLAGCNPNEEVYEELDKYVEPYHENIDVVLEGNDYGKIADLALLTAETAEDSTEAFAVDDYESFSVERSAAKYVPAFLMDEYQALNKNSAANVTYDYYRGEPTYLAKIPNALKDTLQNADYDSLGLDDNYFSSSNPPEDYIPDYLSEKYFNASVGSVVQAFYRYRDGSSTSLVNDYYQLKDEGWESIPTVYNLTNEDYASIEDLGGNNYFPSSSMAAEYIPTFLELRFPYADQGTEKIIAYNYLDDKDTIVRTQQYKLDSAGWMEYRTTISMTSQFVHSGEKWVFDPTVRYEMISSDYQLIVDERDTRFIDSYGTGEFYSGANSYFTNFDLRISQREQYEPETFVGLSEEEAMEIIWDRVLDDALIIFLQKKFPGAVPESNGIDVHYIITFEVYNNNYNHVTYTAEYVCTAPASGDNPPQFEFVEGPTVVGSE